MSQQGGVAIIEEHVFKINQRLEIMLYKHKNFEQYSSRIEEVASKYMVIAMPMSKGRPIFLGKGDTFYGRIAAGGAMYQFSSIYMDKKLQPLPIWVVSLPYDIRKIQQRAFVRIAATIPIELQVMPIDDNEEKPEPFSVMTKDISGGGLQLICKHPLQLGTRLLITSQIPEFGAIEAIGEVVRKEKPQDDRQLFWIGIKFLDIQESARNKLIKFIFKKQLEQRQKGI